MGRITEKITENMSKGQRPKAHCSKCKCETRHIVLQSADQTGSEELDPDEPQFTVEWSNNYQIVQCQGCETISFRHLSWFSEHQDYDSDGTVEKLYPNVVKTTMECKDLINVPPKIRRLYREVIDCFNYECITLCAGGLRAIVEGICWQKGIKKGSVAVQKKDGTKITKVVSTLDGKIGGLCENGFLTIKQAEVLHQHRYLGNEALHELVQPSTSELELAIQIIESILETLYETPDKAAELRRSMARRRSKKAAKSAGSGSKP